MGLWALRIFLIFVMKRINLKNEKISSDFVGIIPRKSNKSNYMDATKESD